MNPTTASYCKGKKTNNNKRDETEVRNTVKKKKRLRIKCRISSRALKEPEDFMKTFQSWEMFSFICHKNNAVCIFFSDYPASFT